MTSAFIIQVQPQLQQDPNEETAALLRVLIYKIDNTTFGSDVPALPQWIGPTRMVVQVQCILYASLAASLLSAFLAMLGKQWLNRYASIDMRGSAIERSQNRQRKLDGIVVWYFNHVLECLPLMLQIALLLLGSALSRYLWEINTAVASVVAGVTSFGALFYLSIIVAGITSDGCPYQTPWTSIIRYLLRLFAKNSALYGVPFETRGPLNKYRTTIAILKYPLVLLFAFVKDVFRFGRATFRLLIFSTHRARSWLFETSPISKQTLDYRAAWLDLRCISWMLRTSLDKTINLLTLNFLKTILALPDLDSDIVVDCFNVFSSCFFTGDNNTAMITRGSEQLAEISAACFFHAFSSLLIAEPTSTTIQNLRKRYKRVFPIRVDLQHLPCPMKAFHHLSVGRLGRPHIAWRCYNPSPDELVPFAHALGRIAQFEYHRRGHESRKVPRWLVRFALRFLSQDPLPPTSVVTDCLTIIATDLGYNVRDIRDTTPDEKCVHPQRRPSLR